LKPLSVELHSSRVHLRELFEVVLAAVVFALFARTFLVQAFVVPTPSMEDTVQVGDHLLVNKFIYAPHRAGLTNLLPYRPMRRGDVIVFKFPEDPQQDFIKRVVALPGDIVEVRGRTVFVNGAPEQLTHGRSLAAGSLPDDPGVNDPLRHRDPVAPIRIPDGAYFVVGDNRDNSYDSRFWGPVPAEDLKGRPLLVYWSSSGEIASAGPWRRLKAFLASTRWSRMFRLVR
jgi:signal peptidase I